MTRRILGIFALALVLLHSPAMAQESHESQVTSHETEVTGHESQAAGEDAHGSSDQIDIAHHIGNSHEIETPFGVIHLPQWEPIRIGNIALDLSPTKHTVFMAFAAVLVALTFLMSARAIRRAEQAGKPARGFAGAMEAMALWIRQEVVLPNVGHHGAGYAPYLLTLFFFILIMNLLGLVPWGASPRLSQATSRATRVAGARL